MFAASSVMLVVSELFRIESMALAPVCESPFLFQSFIQTGLPLEVWTPCFAAAAAHPKTCYLVAILKFDWCLGICMKTAFLCFSRLPAYVSHNLVLICSCAK